MLVNIINGKLPCVPQILSQTKLGIIYDSDSTIVKQGMEAVLCIHHDDAYRNWRAIRLQKNGGGQDVGYPSASHPTLPLSLVSPVHEDLPIISFSDETNAQPTFCAAVLDIAI